MNLDGNRRRLSVAATLLTVASFAGCGAGAGEQISEDEAFEMPSPGLIEPPVSANPEPSVTLPEGTALEARLTQTLSTATHDVDSVFDATLAEPVVIDEQTIVPAGARLWGKVVESDKGGRVEGRAHLAVLLTEMETADGGRISISTDTQRVNAPATKREDAEKIGIGAGVGAAIGAIAGGGKGAAIGAAAGGGAGTGAVLATRGDPAVLPSETLLWFTLRHAVTLD